jgi:RimJ/RimL family protein N-acetyltransferase
MTDIFFETERLVARRFAEGDLDAFVRMRADPAVARYQNWSDFTHIEGREFLDWLAPRSPGQPGWFQFALARRDDGRFVGDVGLKILDDPRLAQVGYTIAPAHWSAGLATEAVRALVAYAIPAFGLHRIHATVDPRNLASVRVLEKAAFTKEAHFRSAEWFKCEWCDDAIYAILAVNALRARR